MTFFTDVRTRQTHIDELQTSVSGTLGAAADIALEESPISSIDRLIELNVAEQGRDIPGVIPPDDELPPREGPDTDVLPAEEARKRIAEEGLKLTIPDDGYPERALEILMKRARERRLREDKLSRSPQGAVPTSLRLATSLGASLLDPTNIALSFMPVVGPVRSAALLARASGPAGRAGVRAGIGVVEGAAGTALVEPLIFAARSQEQADFGLQDALLDIALGGALGGGLHVVGGGAKDFVSARRRSRNAQTSGVSKILNEFTPEAREHLLRTSVGQLASGKRVEVDSLFSLGAESARLRASAAVLPDANAPIELEFSTVSERRGARIPDIIEQAREDNAELFARADELDELLSKDRVEAARLRDRIAEPLDTAQADRLRDIERELSGKVNARRRKRLERVRAEIITESPDAKTKAAKDRAARTKDENRLEKLEQQITGNERGRARIEPRIEAAVSRATKESAGSRVVDLTAIEQRPISRQSIFDEIQVQGRTEQPSALANLDAARAADEKLVKAAPEDDIKALQAETDDIVAEAQETADALELGEEYAADLEAADLTEDAQIFGRAVRALANCQLRRGA